jgi:hypothetical protein
MLQIHFLKNNEPGTPEVKLKNGKWKLDVYLWELRLR